VEDSYYKVGFIYCDHNLYEISDEFMDKLDDNATESFHLYSVRSFNSVEPKQNPNTDEFDFEFDNDSSDLESKKNQALNTLQECCESAQKCRFIKEVNDLTPSEFRNSDRHPLKHPSNDLPQSEDSDKNDIPQAESIQNSQVEDTTHGPPGPTSLTKIKPIDSMAHFEPSERRFSIFSVLADVEQLMTPTNSMTYTALQLGQSNKVGTDFLQDLQNSAKLQQFMHCISLCHAGAYVKDTRKSSQPDVKYGFYNPIEDELYHFSSLFNYRFLCRFQEDDNIYYRAKIGNEVKTYEIFEMHEPTIGKEKFSIQLGEIYESENEPAILKKYQYSKGPYDEMITILSLDKKDRDKLHSCCRMMRKKGCFPLVLCYCENDDEYMMEEENSNDNIEEENTPRNRDDPNKPQLKNSRTNEFKKE